LAFFKSTHETIKHHLERSKNESFCFGAKLVRGAYIEQVNKKSHNLNQTLIRVNNLKETKRAKDLGYENPIQDSFEATTKNYEKNALICMNEIKNRDSKTVKFVFASHNEDTVRYVLKKFA
jgi:hypothetical protein